MVDEQQDVLRLIAGLRKGLELRGVEGIHFSPSFRLLVLYHYTEVLQKSKALFREKLIRTI